MADLVSVVVGGGIAAAAMWLQHRLKVREEWRSRQTEKYVELRSALDKYRAWLAAHEKQAYTGQRQSDVGPTPFSKIEDLCILYFPELVPRVQHFSHFAFLYESQISLTDKPLIERTEADVEELLDQSQRYHGAERAFDAEIKGYAIRRLSRQSMAGRARMKLRQLANQRRAKRKKKAAQRAATTASTGAN
jgi:hypothetical protein